MKKIGIMGGTFNPIHNGHLYLAREALKQLELDEVFWLVSGTSPHKDNEILSRATRREMVSLAITGMEHMVLCDYEIKKEAKGYTYETLEALQQLYPDSIFYFIMGEDSLRAFDTWKCPERIAKVSNIAIAIRSDAELTQLDINRRTESVNAEITRLHKLFTTGYHLLHTQNIPISSSALRLMLKNKESISSYVPDTVDQFIQERHLYTPEKRYDKLIAEILPKLEKKLKPSRYLHTLGVMETAASLAMRYSYPVSKARIAGLLHDCAKCYNEKQLLQICKKNHLPVTKAEADSPHLLHAKVGAFFAESIYHVQDKEILHAIAVHTTGEPGMGLLDQIIFTADYIEPNRSRAVRLDEIREVAFFDLRLAVAMILSDTIGYLKKNRSRLDVKTVDTYNSFKMS